MFNWLERLITRVRKLEAQVHRLEKIEQERLCEQNQHLPGEIIYTCCREPWVRCPACYKTYL